MPIANSFYVIHVSMAQATQEVIAALFAVFTRRRFAHLELASTTATSVRRECVNPNPDCVTVVDDKLCGGLRHASTRARSIQAAHPLSVERRIYDYLGCNLCNGLTESAFVDDRASHRCLQCRMSCNNPWPLHSAPGIRQKDK